MENINFGELLIYIINFIITFVLLYLLLYKPVSKFLSARKERITNSLQGAEDTKKEAEALLSEAKAELAGMTEKARQISHEAIESAGMDAERIIDNAQEEASALIGRAREQMAAERKAAMERAFTEMVSLSSDLASRILTREVSIDDNRKIAERFFTEDMERGDGGGTATAAVGTKSLETEEEQP